MFLVRRSQTQPVRPGAVRLRLRLALGSSLPVHAGCNRFELAPVDREFSVEQLLQQLLSILNLCILFALPKLPALQLLSLEPPEVRVGRAAVSRVFAHVVEFKFLLSKGALGSAFSDHGLDLSVDEALPHQLPHRRLRERHDGRRVDVLHAGRALGFVDGRRHHVHRLLHAARLVEALLAVAPGQRGRQLHLAAEAPRSQNALGVASAELGLGLLRQELPLNFLLAFNS